MFPEKEQEIRRQFLDEASEYVDILESSLLGITAQSLSNTQLDAIRRAAHSLKGGAALMSYTTLSHLAHKLEDGFNSLQNGWICLDEFTESLFLKSIDNLRHCLSQHRQGIEQIDENWLNNEVIPLFEQLEELMSSCASSESSEDGNISEEMDMRVFMFETEVEGCLQNLEKVISSNEKVCLKEEFQIAAQALGGLGEMLELPAFNHLCGEIEQAVMVASEETLLGVVQRALDAWRRSQAIIMIKQFDALPDHFSAEIPSEATYETLGILNCETEEISETDSLDFLAALDAFNGDEEVSDKTVPPWQTDLAAFNLAEEAFSTEEIKENIPKIDAREQAEPVLVTSAVNSSSVSGQNMTPSPPLDSPSDHNVRVSVDKLEQMREFFEELTIEKNGLNLQLQQLHGLTQLLRQRVNHLEGSNRSLRNLYDQSNFTPQSLNLKGEWDVLEMDSYSEIHPVFQDLMETIVQIQEVTGDIEFNLDQTQHSAKDLSRTSGLLQNNLTQVRMRPFSDLVGRFPRAIREMSLKYGKLVNLHIKGESIPIDRMILDALNEPLIHLLRNAFDHGIENPDVRIANGKPPQGNITLEAMQQGNRIVITIKDDGQGINLEKIAEKAQKKDDYKLNKHQLLDLIFEAGFTTASEVTDLSGRGVGMDIVRTQLQRIRGQIQVSTEKEEGTTFIITVPFTLSLIRVLLVESGGMLMAIPSNTVEEMLVISPEMKIESLGQDWLKWDEEMIPLLNLSSWLNFNRLSPRYNSSDPPVINQPIVLMISQGSRLFGLEMDKYWGEQEVTMRTLDSVFPLPTGLTGCTILGDGRVVPLADAMTLINWIEQNRHGSVASHLISSSEMENFSIPNYKPQKTTILVVDDSINVRRFVALTLEKAGYRVQQAKDGQEALEKLENYSIQSVICDIEMPRLDGFGFLAHVRANPQYKTLPIIMLTSRSGEKHRKIAMNLGATDYFAKPFQEQTLLKTLKLVINKQ